MMGKILLWLQERIKLWIKPATSLLIIGPLSDLTRSHADLVVENALLCQQLIVLNQQIKRPQLTHSDRIRLHFYRTLRSSGNKPFTRMRPYFLLCILFGILLYTKQYT